MDMRANEMSSDLRLSQIRIVLLKIFFFLFQPRSQDLFPGLGVGKSRGKGPGNEVVSFPPQNFIANCSQPSGHANKHEKLFVFFQFWQRVNIKRSTDLAKVPK